MGEHNLRDNLIFLDDIIVFSKTFEEHCQKLEAVFECLKRHDLKRTEYSIWVTLFLPRASKRIQIKLLP